MLVGGGSALDVGKCIALLARNPGGVLDYEDRGDNWKRADGTRILPTIALPTTAGTGSEVGRAAVILDPRDHSKKIIFHPRMQPRLVLADPELTYGLPKILTAATGMDALAHCFEAYCAPSYHPMADGIALEGMRLIAANLVRACENGRDGEARAHLLMAAAMGATAFQKGLGLIHALSHPVGGVTGLHHGTANAIFQPYVMVHNRPVIEARMERLARTLELDGAGAGFDVVLDWFLALRRRVGLPESLAGIVSPEQVPATRADGPRRSLPRVESEAVHRGRDRARPSQGDRRRPLRLGRLDHRTSRDRRGTRDANGSPLLRAMSLSDASHLSDRLATADFGSA